jgi:hypothetical protein
MKLITKKCYQAVTGALFKQKELRVGFSRLKRLQIADPEYSF